MLHCWCCEHKTIEERGHFDICPICFWEDDVYIDYSKVGKTKIIPTLYDNGEPQLDRLLDVPSGANNGLTLREARVNYEKFGACEEAMIEYVRAPKDDDK